MRRHTTSVVLAGALAALVSLGSAGTAAAETASGPWAAIAVSMETGRAGVAWDQATSGSAADGARSDCAVRSCAAAVEVANGCASLMQASSGRWGWAYGRSRYDADRVAASYAGRGAHLIAWVCSGDHA
ncbi:DUF4189 domain-containing protein [Actinomycetospora sp. C-140]